MECTFNLILGLMVGNIKMGVPNLGYDLEFIKKEK
jgi:hypothetical protein